MIRTISIRNLGPHENAEINFDPDGTSTVSGPSQVGKSFLLRAAVFALWGCDVDGKPLDARAITEGHDKATVTATLASGTAITRSKTLSGSQTRTIVKGGVAESYKSDTTFAAAMGALGDETLRLIMVPFAWQDLAVGNARPLRDYLAGLLPPVNLRDEVARLMGSATIMPSDPMDAKLAEAARREANRERDELAGEYRALIGRRTAVDATPAPTVPDGLKEMADKIIAAADAWAAFDKEAQKHDAAVVVLNAAVAARKEWEVKRAQIKEGPGLAAVGQAQARVGAAEQVVKDRLRIMTTADSDCETAKIALASARSATDKATVGAERTLRDAEAALAAVALDACPRGGVCDLAAEKRTAAEKRVDNARVALDGVRAGAAERLAVIIKAAEDALATAQASREAAAADLAKAKADLTVAADYAIKMAGECEAEDAAVAALGPALKIPAEPKAPAEPKEPRPLESAVADARDTDTTIGVARGAAAERSRALAGLDAAIETAAHKGIAAKAEADRLDALVNALRRAPSEAAKRQAEVLGDLGPVSLLWGDGDAKSPAVEVRLDGRPWGLSSTGRQVVGDAWLRAAFRRATGLDWVVMFVDREQDVGGQEIPDVSPAVVLRTTDGGEMVVE